MIVFAEAAVRYGDMQRIAIALSVAAGFGGSDGVKALSTALMEGEAWRKQSSNK